MLASPSNLVIPKSFASVPSQVINQAVASQIIWTSSQVTTHHIDYLDLGEWTVWGLLSTLLSYSIPKHAKILACLLCASYWKWWGQCSAKVSMSELFALETLKINYSLHRSVKVVVAMLKHINYQIEVERQMSNYHNVKLHSYWYERNKTVNPR